MSDEIKEEISILKKTLIIFVILLIITCTFEIGILTYAYFNADKVECNFLWCTFTQERRKSFTEMYSECYVNGEQVNCTDYENEFRDYAKHGINHINGVCPGLNDNKTVIDCLKEIQNGTLV